VVSAVTLRPWLAEPLVHFLFAGLALFALVSWWEGPLDEGRTIRLSRDDLLVFLQGRAQVYDRESFTALLAAMPADERKALVRDAALQEALYREGSALDLATADPLIRQRVVQQMRVLLAEEAAAGVEVSDAEVAAFYRDHLDDYRVAPLATFTHVFFAEAPGAEAAARAELALLARERVPYQRAGERGERFLYQLNYAEADEALVASHFGEGFARALFEAEPGAWQGPLRSEHGWHLVLVRRIGEAGQPPLAEIAGRVREDALADKRVRLANAALDALLARYELVVEPGIAD
jgi:peptidyl-prolyl cis-trans isomerase C